MLRPRMPSAIAIERENALIAAIFQFRRSARIGRFLWLALLLPLMVACSRPKTARVEDLAAHQESALKLGSLRGTRDGDRLHAQAMFTDSSSMLTVDLHFTVGVPTRLDSGTWRMTGTGQLHTGNVEAKSVDFLGGQDGPPSIGGTFDLVEPGAGARYRVILPATELKNRL